MDALDFRNVCQEVGVNVVNASVVSPVNKIPPPCRTLIDVLAPPVKNKDIRKKGKRRDTKEDTRPSKKLHQQTLHHFNTLVPLTLFP